MKSTTGINDETLESALTVLRDGVNGRGDENERVSELMDVAREMDVPQRGVAHPKITQAIFRYEFGPEGVRGEIKRAIDTYGMRTITDDVHTL
jgi:hypothetical protein